MIRTPWYTLENYLLAPEGWVRTFRRIFRDKPPTGWGTPEEIAQQIDAIYEACKPLTAYNWVLRHVADQYKTVDAPPYLRNGKAVPPDPADRLRQLGAAFGCPEDLGLVYEQKLTQLNGMSRGELPAYVHGKIVLEELHQRFPTRPRQGKLPLDDYINLYLAEYPDAPDDLLAIVRIIVSKEGK